MTSNGSHPRFADLRSPLAIVLLSAVVTAAATWQAFRTDASTYREQFARDAALRAERLAARVERGLAVVRAAAAAIAEAPTTDPDVAGLMVAARLGPDSAIDAAGWIPLPPKDEAPVGFTVHVLPPGSGRVHREISPGVWEGVARDRLWRAAEAGRPALVWMAAGPLRRVEGLLLAVPIEVGTGQSQPLQPVGFAFGIISQARLDEALRLGDEECPFVVDVVDPYAPPGEAVVRRLATGRTESLDPVRRLLAAGWQDPGTFLQARSDWSIAVAPTPAYRIARRSFASGSVLVLGALLIAVFLVDHFRNVRPTRARVRRLLEDRAQRQQAESALLESERSYRELVEQVNSIILRLNRDGVIAFMNDYGQRLFGFSAEELVGRPVVGTIVPAAEDGGRDLRALLEGICADPDRFRVNVNENVRRDGRRVWISWTNKAVLDEEGALAGVFCVGNDITEQREAEQALRRARQELEERVAERTAELSRANVALRDEVEVHQRATAEIVRLNGDLEARAAELSAANARLQELDRLKSEFLATMSHELRTPLNSIIGFTGILRQGMAGPINPEQGKQLGMVHASATHLLSLINDLLDVSRIEAGKIELDSRPFDLAAVIAEVEASCRPALEQKKLAFRTELPAGGLELVGDRKRCFQVLLNLVGNAVKFTERGEIRVLAAREGRRLRVTVADTGIGIRPEHLGMLFEAFRQVDGSARRVYEGTGLGLYLSRKLLDLLGGDISVESVYGQGSRFTFTIPATPAPAVGTEARP